MGTTYVPSHIKDSKLTPGSYFAGHRLLLEIHRSYGSVSTAQRPVTVVVEKVIEPTTCSPTMMVQLNGQTFILKLYDRFLCPQIRKNSSIPEWNNDREAEFLQFIGSMRGQDFLRNVNNETELESVAEEEAYIYHDCQAQFQSETRAYEIMRPLQDQGYIPRLYATVSYLEHPTTALPQLYRVYGVLLEYIDGFRLADLSQTQIPIPKWPLLAEEALEIVVAAGKLGILNRDVNPRNFMVRKHSQKLVQIDFALCEFEADFTPELWTVVKSVEGEEEALGVRMEDLIAEHGGHYIFKASGLWPRIPLNEEDKDWLFDDDSS